MTIVTYNEYSLICKFFSSYNNRFFLKRISWRIINLLLTHHSLLQLLLLVKATNITKFLPNLSSPKFPHPIFLPTLKLGPTIRTPEDVEEPDGREQCVLLCAMGLVVRCLSSFSLLGWSMILHDRVSPQWVASVWIPHFNTKVCPNKP